MDVEGASQLGVPARGDKDKAVVLLYLAVYYLRGAASVLGCLAHARARAHTEHTSVVRTAVSRRLPSSILTRRTLEHTSRHFPPPVEAGGASRVGTERDLYDLPACRCRVRKPSEMATYQNDAASQSDANAGHR